MQKAVFLTAVHTCMQQNLASGGCSLCMSLETLVLGDPFFFFLNSLFQMSHHPELTYTKQILRLLVPFAFL